MVHVIRYWAHGGPCARGSALCIFLPSFGSILRHADIGIGSDKSGAHNPASAILNRECDCGMSLKMLWRQTQLLKGERGFSKISVNGSL